MFRAQEFSKFKITGDSRRHVKIGPVTEMEVSFRCVSASTVTTIGEVKSWVLISRGVEHDARQFFIKLLNTKV